MWSSSPSLRFGFACSDRRTEAQSSFITFILHLPTVGKILLARQNIAGLSEMMRL